MQKNLAVKEPLTKGLAKELTRKGCTIYDEVNGAHTMHLVFPERTAFRMYHNPECCVARIDGLQLIIDNLQSL